MPETSDTPTQIHTKTAGRVDMLKRVRDTSNYEAFLNGFKYRRGFPRSGFEPWFLSFQFTCPTPPRWIPNPVLLR